MTIEPHDAHRSETRGGRAGRSRGGGAGIAHDVSLTATRADSILEVFMSGPPLVAGIATAVGCTIAVAAATIWLATDVGVPSETAVPVAIVVLLALRSVARRNTTN
jgi:hypothetical protein